MADEVLELARAVLAGRHSVSSSQLPRVAALLARQALEDAVDELCGPEMRRASMRSRLLHLTVLGDAKAAGKASRARRGLSQAWHQHAYEPSATTAEVGYLMQLVSALKNEHRLCEQFPGTITPT